MQRKIEEQNTTISLFKKILTLSINKVKRKARFIEDSFSEMESGLEMQHYKRSI